MCYFWVLTCTKKPFFFPDEMSNGTVQPGENFLA